MMDTSKEYIKMCEKAKEIQRLVLMFNSDKVIYSSVSELLFYDSDVFNMGDIWLPRQDQLQEMIDKLYTSAGYDAWEKKKDDNAQLIIIFSQFVYEAILTKKLGTNPSMEQLWLAFVMKERYSKQWNGEGWVKCP